MPSSGDVIATMMKPVPSYAVQEVWLKKMHRLGVVDGGLLGHSMCMHHVQSVTGVPSLILQ